MLIMLSITYICLSVIVLKVFLKLDILNVLLSSMVAI
jgi:hypothetical protein